MSAKKVKKRLDILLVERNFFPTRSRARAEIMAGNVLVAGKKIDKAGQIISPQAKIEIRKEKNPYVSRGGLKLDKALDEFAINLREKIVLDVGASTGGFTDCALERGAQRVFALDVGYGQLAWKLRNHPRVHNMERFNVRYLKREDLPLLPHFATIDVSFISLRKVLPVIAALKIPEIVCLVKPQFEASPDQVGKKGVVRDKAVHEEVLRNVMALARSLSYRVEGLTFSPLRGPQGNIEYFLYLYALKNGLQPREEKDLDNLCSLVVARAHSFL